MNMTIPFARLGPKKVKVSLSVLLRLANSSAFEEKHSLMFSIVPFTEHNKQLWDYYMILISE